MKKFLVFTMIFCLLLGAIPALATNEEFADSQNSTVVTTFNEYAYWLECQKLNADDSNVMQQDLEASSFDYYGALYERACLPEENLLALGYTSYQISQLKKYAANPTAFSNFYAVASIFNSSVGLLSHNDSDTEFEVAYYWWSSDPLITVTDAFVLSWQAVNENELYMNMICDPGSHSATVSYYDLATGYLFSDESITMSGTQANTLSAAFHASKMSSGLNLWAQNGSATCTLSSDRTPVKYLYFFGSYGHRTVTLGPSISFTVGEKAQVSFTPSFAVDTYSKCVRILNTGDVINL